MFTRLRTKSVDYPFTLLFDIVLTQKLWVYYLPHIPRDHELPIHLACVYGEFCQDLESLLGSYNASIRIRNGHGLLPKIVVADNPNLKVIKDQSQWFVYYVWKK